MEKIDNNQINVMGSDAAYKFDELTKEFGLGSNRLLPIYTFVFACKNLISDYEFVRELLKRTDLDSYVYEKGGKYIYCRLFACLFAYVDQVDSREIIESYASEKDTLELFENRRKNIYERYLHFYSADSENGDEDIFEKKIENMSDGEYLANFMEVDDEQEHNQVDDSLQEYLIEFKEQISVLSNSLALSNKEYEKNREENEQIKKDYETNLKIKDDTISKLEKNIVMKDQEIKNLTDKYNQVLIEKNSIVSTNSHIDEVEEEYSTSGELNFKDKLLKKLFKKNEQVEKKMTFDDVIIKSKDLEAEQLEIIVDAMSKGLSPEQLAEICNNEFSVDKMKQLVRVMETKNKMDLIKQKAIEESKQKNNEEKEKTETEDNSNDNKSEFEVQNNDEETLKQVAEDEEENEEYEEAAGEENISNNSEEDYIEDDYGQDDENFENDYF